MNGSKWPHSRGNGLVNIPYMEHLGFSPLKNPIIQLEISLLYHLFFGVVSSNFEGLQPFFFWCEACVPQKTEGGGDVQNQATPMCWIETWNWLQNCLELPASSWITKNFVPKMAGFLNLIYGYFWWGRCSLT